MLDSDWLSTGVNQTTLPGVSKYPDAFVRRTCHRISPHRTAAGNTFPNSHSCKQNTGTQLRIDLLFCIHVLPWSHFGIASGLWCSGSGLNGTRKSLRLNKDTVDEQDPIIWQLSLSPAERKCLFCHLRIPGCVALWVKIPGCVVGLYRCRGCINDSN